MKGLKGQKVVLCFGGMGRHTETSVDDGPDAAVQHTSRVCKAAKSAGISTVKTRNVGALGEGLIVDIGNGDLVC